MKKILIGICALFAICLSACKSKDSKVDSADSGQIHVGGSTAADSAKYPATPVETGGQDTSADGVTNTNTSKDTVKNNP
jgi:hypothetical protein